MGDLHGSAIEVRRRSAAGRSLLLNRNAADGVDDFEAELVDEAIMLVQHLPLKESKALERIGAPAEVHARLVELELDAAGHEAVERDVDRDPEVERQIRLDREAVELAHPLAVDAARRVAGERRVARSDPPARSCRP